jgi:hypothetical protein
MAYNGITVASDFLNFGQVAQKLKKVWPTAPAKYFARLHITYVHSDNLS